MGARRTLFTAGDPLRLRVQSQGLSCYYCGSAAEHLDTTLGLKLVTIPLSLRAPDHYAKETVYLLYSLIIFTIGVILSYELFLVTRNTTEDVRAAGVLGFAGREARD